MSRLLSREQWTAPRRLYIAGRKGIEHDGARYGDAGPWPVLKQLRDHDPPLIREVFRQDKPHGGLYCIVITEARRTFYEDHEKRHDLFYPPQ